MRACQFWWRTLVQESRNHPPQFIELVMGVLALGWFMIWGCALIWQFSVSWPYLILCMSYTTGTMASILVRQLVVPSSHPQVTQSTMAVLLLINLLLTCCITLGTT
ncbi:hypothetical protein DO97_14865 [Neosynechococcus sphagnicola sy1]|uniref:Uncharacterized protein n=1 Tax=Neosynechococcus sphagnicola sy1 TaxID=1497020 RepID=A0A098TIH8_9CYAN|nr:hypothetical protein [Neosynechococcus sphagnicola]KGF71831.1 hypothetical protein DO97_14865 [Neosynechococcus sphagnicola sy1]